MAFSLYESGVTSLKLKSTTHFPLEISISVALNPRLPGNMLTNISFSLDVFLQYSNASIKCTLTESKFSNSLFSSISTTLISIFSSDNFLMTKEPTKPEPKQCIIVISSNSCKSRLVWKMSLFLMFYA